METKDARRRRKLKQLEEATVGGLESIAVASGRNPAYLKQIINGTLLPPKKDGSRSPRALGDDVAEKIEDTLHLGRGWFDSDRPVPSTSHQVNEPKAAYVTEGWPFKNVSRQQYLTLSPEQITLVEDLILQFFNVREPPSKHLEPESKVASR